ncbi:hypothetical protein [Oceanobacillus kimchii]|nr:hypothetical protein [Oceanobacillus kimchii]
MEYHRDEELISDYAYDLLNRNTEYLLRSIAMDFFGFLLTRLIEENTTGG